MAIHIWWDSPKEILLLVNKKNQKKRRTKNLKSCLAKAS
jgi:hypothetical protein